MDRNPLRILVALDGTAGSETILSALVSLARFANVDLTLLRVAGTPEEAREARDYLDRLAPKLESPTLGVTAFVHEGEAGPSILERLHSGAYDFGALTTHARRGLSRLIAGSVAEGVIRASALPLLINRPDGRTGDWKVIVVALDGSPAAEAVLDEAARLALRIDAGVHLVHVAEIPMTVPATELSYRAVTAPELKPYLDSLRNRLAAQGVRSQAASLVGYPPSEIAAYARNTDAGLVALTTVGRTGLRRVILGSVAERIIRLAPCPVLVQRAVKDQRPAPIPDEQPRATDPVPRPAIMTMPGLANM